MTVSTTAAASPFKGLVPFGESDLDALFFFGREREIEVISANLLAASLTVLYGPTGVGKSSVLGAGVVRALRAVPFRREVVVHSEWADEPARRLALEVAEAAGLAPRDSLVETLADAGAALDGELYLILDQLEEYFVYHGGGLEPGSFTSELAAALTQSGVRANVLLSLREDSLARLDVLKTRVPGLFSNYLRLDHLDRDAARNAIVGPVERWNELFGAGSPVVVEPGLTDMVLDGSATAGSPDRIEAPYLQLVLERLWEVERAQSSHALQMATLVKLGGAEQIVGDHLRRAMRQLTADEQVTAAAVFHQMVTPSGTKIAHTIGDLARYASVDEGAVRRVADRLVAERILRPVAGPPGGERRIEIFHDVLAAPVLDWGTRFEARRAEATARRAAEVRHRRATIVAAASLLALVVVAAIAVFALTQRSQARDSARSAHANALTAQALLLQSSDPGRALGLALHASRLEPGRQTEAVLRSSLIASRLRRTLGVGDPVTTLAWIGSGRLAIGSSAGRVLVWRTDRDRIIRTLDVGASVDTMVWDEATDRLLVLAGGKVVLWSPTSGQPAFRVRSEAPIADATVGADGRVIATAATDGVALWRAADGRLLRRVAAPRAVRVVFAPDDRTLAVVRSSADGRVTPSTYDTRTGQRLASLAQRGIRAVMFSPDSSLLATGSANGTVVLWRPRSGEKVRTLDDGGGSIASLAFDRGGSMLATASSDGDVRVWRLSDGTRFFLFLGHGAAVNRVTFSPDGLYLASTSDDRTARIWTVGGIGAGRLAAVLAGSAGSVSAVAYAPHGHSLVTGSADGTARLWEPRIEQQLSAVAAEPGRADAVRVLPTGAIVSVADRLVRTRANGRVESLPVAGSVFALSRVGTIAVSSGRRITVETTPTGTELLAVAASATVSALGFRDDGRELVAVAGRTVLIWDVHGRRLLHRFRAEPGIVRPALSTRGGLVAAGDRSGTIHLWSADGTLRHVLRGHRKKVTDLRFEPGDARLVSASEGISDNAIVWDVGSGRPAFHLIGHFGTVTAASFSPDGRWILTAGPISAAIWFSERGQLLFYLRGPADLLTDAEWVPADFVVATAERDGTLREYRCIVCRPLDGLQAFAETRLAAMR